MIDIKIINDRKTLFIHGSNIIYKIIFVAMPVKISLCCLYQTRYYIPPLNPKFVIQ